MKTLIANDSVNLTVVDEKSPIRILISSLSLGGAEKIVADWATSEGNRGRKVEIAVIHSKEKEHKIKSSNVKIYRRGEGVKVSEYLSTITEMWSGDIPVSTHLVDYAIHSYLWERNVKTVPVIHNDRKGWKIDPTLLNHEKVVSVVACASYVKEQLIEDGYKGQVMVVRHSPLIEQRVFDQSQREKLRNNFGIDKDSLVVGLIGAIKKQKNYTRLIDIAKKTNKKIEFLIFGDAVNQEGELLKKELMQRVLSEGLEGKVIFMGFREDVFSYFPILDAVLNCSHYEGYSIATQEALLSGLPVIATNVSGQSEIQLDGLTLIDHEESDQAFVDALEALSVRSELSADKLMNASRIWSLTTTQRESTSSLKTLFLTANLNAGGAQRSLVNLATHINDDLAIAVCNSTTNDYFPEKLNNAGVEHFQLSESRDVFDLTQVLLNVVTQRNVENLVLWNVDPKMKLLLSEFLPVGVKFFDISPGGYAFEELDATVEFQKATTIKSEDFYSRLDKLVLKYDADTQAIAHYDVETMVVRNGVEDWSKGKVFDQENKEIMVSGRIVESKHILSIVKAFKEFNDAMGQEYRLNFYGQAEERNKDYLDSVVGLIKGERVVFHGSDPYLSFMEKNFAMTIVLGTHQGCPNAVLESASGLIPVIANDSGGTREIVRDDVSGLLIPDQFTHKDLLSAMFKMVESDRLKYINNAKEIVDSKFSMSLMMDNYKALFGYKEIEKAKAA